MRTVRQSVVALEKQLRKRQAAARTWGELGDLQESASLAQLPTADEIRAELQTTFVRVRVLRKLLRLVMTLDREGRR